MHFIAIAAASIWATGALLALLLARAAGTQAPQPGEGVESTNQPDAS